MTENDTKTMVIKKSRTSWVFFVLIAIGVATFVFGLTSQHPARAWQTYLINFLLWSVTEGIFLTVWLSGHIPISYSMFQVKFILEIMKSFHTRD